MKRMKKTISILLALVMILAMSMTVFAEEPAETTYTITINNPNPGYAYEAYQVFDGDYHDGVLSNITWGTGIGDSSAFMTELKKISEFSSCDSPAKVAEALEKGGTVLAEKFADVAGKHLSTIKTASTGSNPYIIRGLYGGYYLVKDTTVPAIGGAHTDYILKVVKDVTATPKSAIPTVIKKVQENTKYNQDAGFSSGFNDVADWSIGNDISFKLIGTLPNDFADYTTYKYIFHDTLGTGLTYNADSVEVHLVNGPSAEEIKDITKSFDVACNSATGELTISCQNIKGIQGADWKADTSKIVVDYTAKLNGNAVIGKPGNENKVYLEYSNNPNSGGENSTGKTAEDKVVVFTYELDLTKVDGSDQNIKLQGAEFRLHNSATPVQWAVADKGGKITGWVQREMDSSTFTSGTDGTFKIIGLDDGTYHLKETKAPNGYNLMEKAIHLTISATTNNGQAWDGITDVLTGLTLSVNDAEPVDGNTASGIVSATIENNKGTTLPETGGMGTTMFYIVGAILVIGAGVLLVTRRRMRNEE